MSRPAVLILTRSDDNPSVELVAEAIRARGGEPLRLDTDRYPEHVLLSTELTAAGLRRVLRTRDGNRNLDDLHAVWYRRFFAGGRLPAALGDTREACVNESRRTLYGMIAALDAFQLDPLAAVRSTDHKELQLKRAQALGLAIPRTLITNDPDSARQFIREATFPVVTKMQSSFAIYRHGLELVVYTTPIDPANLDGIEDLRYCPMVFQEKIEKRFDIRATVVGRTIHAAALDSQTRDRTATDWRRDGLGTISSWQPFELPPDAARALLSLVASFGLNYAAADFVLGRDDRLTFLEINAGGEWFWLQRSPGLPIAESLADVLLGLAPRVAAPPPESAHRD